MQIRTFNMDKHMIELLTVIDLSLLDITTGGDWSYGLSRLSRSAWEMLRSVLSKSQMMIVKPSSPVVRYI